MDVRSTCMDGKSRAGSPTEHPPPIASLLPSIPQCGDGDVPANHTSKMLLDHLRLRVPLTHHEPESEIAFHHS